MLLCWVTVLSVVMLSAVMSLSWQWYVVFSYGVCCYAVCYYMCVVYSECCYVDCHYAGHHSVQGHCQSECHCTKCHYADSRGARDFDKTQINKYFITFLIFSWRFNIFSGQNVMAKGTLKYLIFESFLSKLIIIFVFSHRGNLEIVCIFRVSYAERNYTECHYAECHYTECH